MANGDVVSVTVGADGWYADVVLAGLNTGGTYAFGLGANDDPLTGTPKITFTVVSLGYSGGSATTVTRTIYATHAVRNAYPSDATNHESFDGTNTTVRVALSDWIFNKDTSQVVSILSGFYTKSAVPNNASGGGFAVTNSSAMDYPKCIVNWARPGNERITGDFTVAVVGFHGISAWNGPAQAGGGKHNIDQVVFTATDGTHPTNSISTAPAYDSTYGDAVPVCEHAAIISVAGLTQGAVITVNFKAYPLIGDSGSIVDSSDGANTQPTPLYAPITFLNDKNGTLGTCALVDPTGVDPAGSGSDKVYDSASFDPITAYKFLTIPKAVSAIAAYNNANHSRNCAAGGTVYCNNGSYSLGASGLSYGSMTPDCLVTITRTPAATRAGVIITTNSGDFTIGGSANTILKMLDVAITSSTNFLFYNQLGVWFDKSNLTLSGTAQVFVTPLLWVTRCNVVEFDDGIGPYTDANASAAPVLVRGNNLNGFNQSILSYTVIGNSKTDGTTSSAILFTLRRWASQGTPNTSNGIVAFNKVMKWSYSTILSITTASGYVNTRGYAAVQNLFEFVGPFGGNPLNTNPVIDLSLDALSIPNVLIWNSTFLGERCNIGYNSSGGTPYAKNFWSIKNNLFGDWNIKSDTFGPGQDGARIGNWPVIYGVGCGGNFHAENVSDGASGQFLSEFSGLKSVQPATSGQPPSGTGFADNYFAFTDDKSWHSGAVVVGGGDYTLTSGSPAKGASRDWLIPRDISGVLRTTPNDAGPYASANALTSSGFMLFFG